MKVSKTKINNLFEFEGVLVKKIKSGCYVIDNETLTTILNTLNTEMKDIHHNFDSLSDKEKGDKIDFLLKLFLICSNIHL